MTPEQNSYDGAQKPTEDQRASASGAGDKPVASVTLSPAEFEELMTLAKERDEYLKRLQRAVADYQNLQKRMERFREVTRMDVFRSLAEGILPVADNLDLALEAARQADGCEEIVRGLELTAKNFYEALERLGIRPAEAMGQKFDPHYHEAAMQLPHADAPPNTVIKVLKKGFVLGDQVIRPSQVIVAAGTDSATGASATGPEERSDAGLDPGTA